MRADAGDATPRPAQKCLVHHRLNDELTLARSLAALEEMRRRLQTRAFAGVLTLGVHDRGHDVANRLATWGLFGPNVAGRLRTPAQWHAA
jgi:hypothetical protein